MSKLKLVLGTYTALRQMSPDDIALLETLRALNDGDRELMVETLQGKAMGKKAGKKSSTSKSRKGGCAACDYSKVAPIHHDSTLVGYHVYQPTPRKSERASDMATVLKSRVRQQRETTKDDDYQGFAIACAHEWTTGSGRLTICTMPADANVHHLKTHPDYHEFVEGKSAAPPAPAPSSANGGVGSTESTETATA